MFANYKNEDSEETPFGNKGQKYTALESNEINDNTIDNFFTEFNEIPIFQKTSEMIKRIDFSNNSKNIFKVLYDNLIQITQNELANIPTHKIINSSRMNYTFHLPYHSSPFECIQNNDLEGIKIWLEANESPDETFNDINLLDYAYQQNNLEIVRILIQANASICYKGKVVTGNIDITQFHSNQSKLIFIKLKKAIDSKNLNMVKVFVEYGKIPQDVMNASLLEAVTFNAYDIAQYFLSKGARNNDAFILAYKNKNMFYFDHHKITKEEVPSTAANGAVEHIIAHLDLESFKDFFESLVIENLRSVIDNAANQIVAADKVEMLEYILPHIKNYAPNMNSLLLKSLPNLTNSASLLYKNGARIDKADLNKLYHNVKVSSLVALKNLGHPLPDFHGVEYDSTAINGFSSQEIEEYQFIKENYPVEKIYKFKEIDSYIHFYSSIKNGIVEIAKEYADKKINLIRDENTPLIYAMRHNQLGVFEAIIDIVLSKKQYKLENLLVMALSQNRMNFASFILEYRPNYNPKNYKMTVLYPFLINAPDKIDFLKQHSIPIANSIQIINELIKANDVYALEYVMSFQGTSNSYGSNVFNFIKNSGNEKLYETLLKTVTSNKTVCELTLKALLKERMLKEAEEVIDFIKDTKIDSAAIIRKAYEYNLTDFGRKVIAKFGMPNEKQFNIILFTQIVKCNDIEILSMYLETDACKPLSAKKEMAIGIMIAASQGNIAIVRKLIDSDVPIVREGPLSKLYKLDVLWNESYNSALIAACAKNHIEILDYLLEKGAPLILEGQKDFEALNEAARNGNLDIISKLIGIRNDIRFINDAAGYAILGDQMEALKMLISYGANINYMFNYEYKTPLLSLAIMLKKDEFAYYLLEEGAIIGRVDDKSNSSLYYAITTGNFKMILHLLQFWKVFPKSEIDKSLFAAVKNQYTNIARILFSLGGDPNYVLPGQNNTTFCIACDNEFMPIIELLVGKTNLKAEPINGISPEAIAYKNNNIQLLNYLHEKGMQLRYRSSAGSLFITYYKENNIELLNSFLDKIEDFSAIHEVTKRDLGDLLSLVYQSNNKDMLISLLDRGIDPNFSNDNILYRTFSKNDIETAELLMNKYGAKFQDNKYYIKKALDECITQTFKKMLDLGFDPNIKVTTSQIPLICYLIQGLGKKYLNIQAVEALLKFDLDKSAVVASTKESPIHIAAKMNNFNLIEKLVLAGYDINAQAHSGKTPLMLCLTAEKVPNESFMTLLKLGADTNIPENNEITPLMHCCSAYMYDIATLLIEKHNANINYITSDGKSILWSIFANSICTNEKKQFIKYVFKKNIVCYENQKYPVLYNLRHFAKERNIIKYVKKIIKDGKLSKEEIKDIIAKNQTLPIVRTALLLGISFEGMQITLKSDPHMIPLLHEAGAHLFIDHSPTKQMMQNLLTCGASFIFDDKCINPFDFNHSDMSSLIYTKR